MGNWMTIIVAVVILILIEGYLFLKRHSKVSNQEDKMQEIKKEEKEEDNQSTSETIEIEQEKDEDTLLSFEKVKPENLASFLGWKFLKDKDFKDQPCYRIEEPEGKTVIFITAGEKDISVSIGSTNAIITWLEIEKVRFETISSQFSDKTKIIIFIAKNGSSIKIFASGIVLACNYC